MDLKQKTLSSRKPSSRRKQQPHNSRSMPSVRESLHNGMMTPEMILVLQRTIGNQAIQRIISPKIASNILVQRQPWKMGDIYPDAIQDFDWHTVANQFLDHYDIVQQAELGGVQAEPLPEFKQDDDNDDSASALIEKKGKDKGQELKEMVIAVATEVAEDILKQLKAMNPEIIEQISTVGPAGLIEERVLTRIIPHMELSLKSLVPLSHKRKNLLTAVGISEGLVDIIYNTLGLTIEALSAGLATPLVAGGGGAYKGGFAGAKSKLAGESKSQQTLAGIMTAIAETAQALIPGLGSAWGISGGARGVYKSSRVKKRMKALISGQSHISPRAETQGDRRVSNLLQERSNYVDDLIKNGMAQGYQSDKLMKKLIKAQKWLNEQIRKTKKRFGQQNSKGTTSLISDAATDASASSSKAEADD